MNPKLIESAHEQLTRFLGFLYCEVLNMTFIELFLLSLGLSMDAFAVAICIGLTMAKTSIKKAITVGLYFGLFQAGMPLLGYLIATVIAGRIIDYGQWVAFGLLCVLGIKMIFDGLKKEQSNDTEYSVELKKMLPLAIATSIDALAVGVSFAFLQVRILQAVSFIGVTTFLISIAGVKIGSVFGEKYKAKAQVAGGIILVLIGIKIILEHLEIINV
jgi:putative Mn2+ efflux pump MntP